MNVYQVTDEKFKKYGRIIKGLDVTELMEKMEETPLPENEVIYIASVPELEALPVYQTLTDVIYGEMPIQIGCCNGFNKLLNAAEYHRDSEVNVAVTDLVLMLGKRADVEDDFRYDSANIEAFFLPKGTVVEVFGDTLDDDLFKEKLGNVSIKQLTRTAKERRPGSMGYAEAMIIEYNGKKKNNAYRLHINKLYSYKHSLLKQVDSLQDDMLRDEASAFFDPDFFEEESQYE